MVEIFLEILVAVFSVFGLYAFAHALGALIFKNENVRAMLLVDSAMVAREIRTYLDDAENACFLMGRRKLSAVIREPYATPELLGILNQKRIPYEIVTENGHSEV
jgi:hypothetical protein